MESGFFGSIINVGVAEKNSAVSTFFYEKKLSISTIPLTIKVSNSNHKEDALCSILILPKICSD